MGQKRGYKSEHGFTHKSRSVWGLLWDQKILKFYYRSGPGLQQINIRSSRRKRCLDPYQLWWRVVHGIFDSRLSSLSKIKVKLKLVEIQNSWIIWFFLTLQAKMNFIKLQENEYKGEDYTFMVQQKRKQLLRPSKSSGNFKNPRSEFKILEIWCIIYLGLLVPKFSWLK